MNAKATGKLTQPELEWVERWLSAVAEGRSTMSQRTLASVEASVSCTERGGGLKQVKDIAGRLGVHLDKGKVLIAASRHQFKVIA